ncbi:MAG TPA: hypothetical protein VFL69_10210 [Marmoricola sp.]|nr:hypothetical protein [Marmoricola sp.]
MAPLPAPVVEQLRRATLDFVAAATGLRALPTTVHVGAPLGERIDVVSEHWFDAGLRTELVAQALAGLDEPTFAVALPWLTRSGDLETHDADLAWCAASLAAFGRYGAAPPGFFVVTRRGWLDLLSGEARTWSRVRPARWRR